MPHSQSLDAIVLKTYDVGEADRFCILFTRERGRIAARASGARRMTSRLGGALLPFQHITVELKEGAGGWFISGARTESVDSSQDEGVRGFPGVRGPDLVQFVALEEGIELLLRLVTDEGALPDVFDATRSFITACREGMEHASLGYGFVLLHCLGLLPGEGELEDFSPLGDHERAYLQYARKGMLCTPDEQCDLQKLVKLRSVLLSEHLATPLRTTEVIAAMV